MKIFICLWVMVSTSVFAADLNLKGGETATILANVNTQVSCNAGPDDRGGDREGRGCGAVIQALKTLTSACETTYSRYTCKEKYWPTFKQNNPRCYFAAIPYCMEACQTLYSAASCAEQCQ